jgi:hypothetical protein
MAMSLKLTEFGKKGDRKENGVTAVTEKREGAS